MVVLTDFVDTVTAELMIENLARLARRHLVLFSTLRDPALGGDGRGAPADLTDLNRAMVARDLLREREVVLLRLRRLGAQCVDAPPGGLEHAAHQPLPRHQAAGAGVKSVEFRREREATWGELEALVARVEASGLSQAGRGGARAAAGPLPRDAVLASAWRAPSRSTANVLEYLESLAARAYVCVYGAKRPAREAARRFLSERFPATVRALRRQRGAVGRRCWSWAP